ncbi:MAG: hypothetical protein KIT73_07845, partial [Burkholderiales bacterium]|nr:hypothetical protein [Burkholderiales bacterium]
DSYEAERRPVARDVIDASAMRQHAVFATGTLARLARDLAISIVGHLPAAQKFLRTELSETEITYRDGPLVALGSPPRHPHRTDAGTRARDATVVDPATGAGTALWPILAGAHHTLLVFEDGDAGDTFGDLAAGFDSTLLRILHLGLRSDPGGEVRIRYRMAAPGWVLVRPDQVIAGRGPIDDRRELDTYLDRVLRVVV